MDRILKASPRIGLKKPTPVWDGSDGLGHFEWEEAGLRVLLLLALPALAMGLWSHPCTQVQPSLLHPLDMRLTT